MSSQSCNLYIDRGGELLVACGDFLEHDHRDRGPFYEFSDGINRRAIIINVSFFVQRYCAHS